MTERFEVKMRKTGAPGKKKTQHLVVSAARHPQSIVFHALSFALFYRKLSPRQLVGHQLIWKLCAHRVGWLHISCHIKPIMMHFKRALRLTSAWKAALVGGANPGRSLAW
jgi:hypothetical protein